MNEGQRSIIIPIRVHTQIMPFMYVRSVVVVRLLRFLLFYRKWSASASLASLPCICRWQAWRRADPPASYDVVCLTCCLYRAYRSSFFAGIVLHRICCNRAFACPHLACIEGSTCWVLYAFLLSETPPLRLAIRLSDIRGTGHYHCLPYCRTFYHALFYDCLGEALLVFGCQTMD